MRRARAVAWAAVVGCLAGACSSSSQAPAQNCPVGDVRCPCTSGGACNPGLQCLSGLCVGYGEAGPSVDGSPAGDDASEASTNDATVPDGGTGDATMASTDASPCVEAGPEASLSACDGGLHTILRGRVYDPASANPLYGVVVYVPGAQPAPLPSVLPCAPCAGLYTSPLASAVTDEHGDFTLVDPPAGGNVPLVVQQGKWRMQYTIATVPACQDTLLPDHTLRLPKNHAEGDIPQIAVSTGAGDSLECVFRRMGVDPAEYVAGPGTQGGGHIHIFTGAGSIGGAALAGGTAFNPAASLWDKIGDIQPYDLVLFSCEGQPTASMNSAGQQVILDYASGGGRVFAPHYHYAILDTGPFAALTPALATWNVSGLSQDNDPIYGKIVQTLPDGGLYPEGLSLDRWLGNVGALDDGGELPIHYARDNAEVAPANAGTQPWIVGDRSSVSPGTYTQVFSFDLPRGPGAQCGRVVYSDLHATGGPQNVTDPNTDYPNVVPGVVPTGCAMRPLTPQEQALEFVIFDLSSCLVPAGQVPRGP